jgi:hypothetical protein
LGLRRNRGGSQPVEKLVELKALSGIPLGKDHVANGDPIARRALNA